MKKYFLILVTIINIICPLHKLFAQDLYHSEASLPYMFTATRTSFEMMLDENKINPLEFGVVFAKDNDTLPYILFAPIRPLVSPDDLSGINFEYSVAVPIDKMKELLSFVESAKSNWGIEYGPGKGIGIEFIFAPENKIKNVSPNVIKWEASLAFYYVNNSNGPKARLVIGKDSESKSFLFDAKKLIIFTETIKKAISKSSQQ